MNLTNIITFNLYSIILLIIIYFHFMINEEKDSLQNKLYLLMLQITILLLIVDIFSRFDGKADTIYFAINHVANFLIFIINPILPSIWILYVHITVLQDAKKTRRLLVPLIAINVINAGMVVFTQYFGWYYFIDANNIYHRGPLFLVSGFSTIALILIAFVFLFINRSKLKKRQYYSLIFFAVLPFACIILQMIYYGISLMLNSVVLSLLIVFLNIQNRGIFIDYLTGVNNRKKLDSYLKKKINASVEGNTFSAIMIDLNNFKAINDSFGHDEGDRVLQDCVGLLKNCLKQNDFIARYGGDEFCVILDTSQKADLDEMIQRMNQSIDSYNRSGNRPYQVGFSMGYAIYDYKSQLKIEEFQKLIDIQLYKNKQRIKNAQ